MDEIHLVVVRVVEIHLLRVWGVGIGLVVGWRSQMTCHYSLSKLTRFLCRGIEIDMISEWESKLT